LFITLKIREEAQILGKLFSMCGKSYALILTKNGLSYISGDYLAISSGQPALDKRTIYLFFVFLQFNKGHVHRIN
jgi:hypothetical protein